MEQSSDALAGITVLDLTRARAGPTAARQLADWGADVIRIETPGASDEADVISSSRDGADFQNLHRNKRCIALDLKSPEGVALFRRLAERADVIIENYRPGVKYRLGIDQKTMLALNPRLIYASISGFGETGPYADRPGVDQIVQGMSGLMSVTGEPGRGPMRAGIAIADTSAGIACAFGIMVALFSRERTGKGQWVSTSLLHSLIFMMDFQVARWLVDGQVAKQAGNDHPTAIPTGVFHASDGPFNIAASGQKMWKRFCQAAKIEHLVDDPRFKTAPLRSANRAELNALITEVIGRHTSQHWIEVLNAAGVPAGSINSIDRVFDDPQVRHLDLCRPLTTASGRNITLVEQPVRLDGTPSRMRKGAPNSGQDTDDVLGEIGLSAEEVDELRRRGVVG
jgi:crotonobetainyl-CoA:carnitine CoA-transferase CaiB-like acyl-CoA transferase